MFPFLFLSEWLAFPPLCKRNRGIVNFTSVKINGKCKCHLKCDTQDWDTTLIQDTCFNSWCSSQTSPVLGRSDWKTYPVKSESLPHTLIRKLCWLTAVHTGPAETNKEIQAEEDSSNWYRSCLQLSYFSRLPYNQYREIGYSGCNLSCLKLAV